MAVIVVPVLCVTSTGREESFFSFLFLVLFLQVLALLSVLHCLPPAGHVEPVFSDNVFSAAVRRNNSELYNTEKKALFATCSPPLHST